MATDHSQLRFWDNLDPDRGVLPKRILDEIGLTDAFTQKGGQWCSRSFPFPAEEDSLRELLAHFLERLRDYVNAAQQVDI
jgi:hypothetical protein